MFFLPSSDDSSDDKKKQNAAKRPRPDPSSSSSKCCFRTSSLSPVIHVIDFEKNVWYPNEFSVYTKDFFCRRLERF